jgi:hypothetical protein
MELIEFSEFMAQCHAESLGRPKSIMPALSDRQVVADPEILLSGQM